MFLVSYGSAVSYGITNCLQRRDYQGWRIRSGQDPVPRFCWHCSDWVTRQGTPWSPRWNLHRSFAFVGPGSCLQVKHGGLLLVWCAAWVPTSSRHNLQTVPCYQFHGDSGRNWHAAALPTTSGLCLKHIYQHNLRSTYKSKADGDTTLEVATGFVCLLRNIRCQIGFLSCFIFPQRGTKR